MSTLWIYQRSCSNGGKVIPVSEIRSTTPGRGNLRLFYLRLVGVVVDVILTLNEKSVSGGLKHTVG